MLVLWEAQFGDFANGAQVIIDQFIVSREAKWQRTSGLVMLLPHGYEGQGPEHSNAYLERYLAACAEDNIQVCNPTTPAQYFHVLRRQMRRTFRRPLIFMTPKSLLRLTRGRARRWSELERGTLRGGARRSRATGRAAAAGALQRQGLLRPARGRGMRPGSDDVALVRVEQLYPFPARRLDELAGPLPRAELVWAQEEPHNRGAWAFIEPRLRALVARSPAALCRPAGLASPAVGSLQAPP